jgi:methylamine dehydrogenase accessory protein MauD
MVGGRARKSSAAAGNADVRCENANNHTAGSTEHQESLRMMTAFILSNILLWCAVLALGFLLLGALRAHGILDWKLEELEATTPNRIGRTGLKPGQPAPGFSLPRVGGGQMSLRDFAGRPVLLVFVQAGCGPCHSIVPDLNALARKGEQQVVAVNNAEPEIAREWADDVNAQFPVLIQEHWKVSRSFEVYATPFAFLIDAGGVVRSAGIAGSRQHLGYVLSRAGRRARGDQPEPGRTGEGSVMSDDSVLTKEMSHV